jgi:hypothetical protein
MAVVTEPDRSDRFAAELRGWRAQRRWSQLDLAIRAR